MDKVEVTQSARDAQADLYERFREWGRAADIRAGLMDDHPGVQAIAAAEQRGFKLCQDAAVKVAETAVTSVGGQASLGSPMAQHIADAIRTLSIKETGNAVSLPLQPKPQGFQDA